MLFVLGCATPSTSSDGAPVKASCRFLPFHVPCPYASNPIARRRWTAAIHIRPPCRGARRRPSHAQVYQIQLPPRRSWTTDGHCLGLGLGFGHLSGGFHCCRVVWSQSSECQLAVLYGSLRGSSFVTHVRCSGRHKHARVHWAWPFPRQHPETCLAIRGWRQPTPK